MLKSSPVRHSTGGSATPSSKVSKVPGNGQLSTPLTPGKPSAAGTVVKASPVQVFCRIRPHMYRADSTPTKPSIDGSSVCVKNLKDKTLELQVGKEEDVNNFEFDRVFGPDATQEEIFDAAGRQLVKDVLDGYNATLFAYGQTGSGKTYTMEGDFRDKALRGIIPRSVEALFDGVPDADVNIEFTFKVSFIEVYMEKIRDLLDSNHVKSNLVIREDKVKGICIPGVTEEYVSSQEELLTIMTAGAANRATAATGMNEGSSRSHSVFTISVTQRDTRDDTVKIGKLVLVDLAGSEMVRKTNATGQQLEEAKLINKSLSALGQVINALADDKATHIPYRDSKLTRILQDSLGGNSKTALIVNASPATSNANETLSTLRFGLRAKNIENKVTQNRPRSIDDLDNMLNAAERALETKSAHILSLQAQLQALQGKMDEVSHLHNENTWKINAGTANEFDSDDDSVSVCSRSTVGNEAVGTIMRLEAAVENLNRELIDERAESQRKDAELESLKEVLKDKDHVSSTLTSISATYLRQFDEKFKALAQSKDKTEQEAQEYLMQLRVQEERFKTLEQTLAETNQQKEELEESNILLQGTKDELRFKIADLEVNIAKAITEKDSALALIQMEKETNKVDHERIDKITSQLNSSLAKLIETEHARKDAESHLKSAEADIQKHQDSVKKLTNKLDDQKQRLELSVKELEDTTTSLRSAEAEIVELSARYSQQVEELSIAKKNAAVSSANERHLEQELTELRLTYDDLKKKTDDERKILLAAQSAAKSEVVSLKSSGNGKFESLI